MSRDFNSVVKELREKIRVTQSLAKKIDDIGQFLEKVERDYLKVIGKRDDGSEKDGWEYISRIIHHKNPQNWQEQSPMEEVQNKGQQDVINFLTDIAKNGAIKKEDRKASASIPAPVQKDEYELEMFVEDPDHKNQVIPGKMPERMDEEEIAIYLSKLQFEQEQKQRQKNKKLQERFGPAIGDGAVDLVAAEIAQGVMETDAFREVFDQKQKSRFDKKDSGKPAVVAAPPGPFAGPQLKIEDEVDLVELLRHAQTGAEAPDMQVAVAEQLAPAQEEYLMNPSEQPPSASPKPGKFKALLSSLKERVQGKK